ncbi:pyruvate oxidase [Agrilactobacillus fermenti]|uniref:pyruvate oxidase n=1 Tax=Agrilactobacillus fermenti TaxID=2586909 RepID=UPI001E486026|nr:pyruvate oxidase [Agrilactobacillus fermenti]MCD2255397.1 pyruvate oxidase [Agrilactobacillus fermenti]
MTDTIKSGVAMVKVLEDWGVDHLYGIPGGSFNSTMDALFEEQAKIKYIQVRHEETGAIAAAADAKLTGKIGVTFGSAGPGATHLFNGLYDAKMDHVPVLALIGQVAASAMNTDFFQELNENPMFADVSVYNRTVMTPEQLPHVVDQAIRQAYAKNGVAVVTIPVSMGWEDIPDTYVSTAHNYRKPNYEPDVKDVDEAIKLLDAAKRPVLYVGQGIRGGSDVAQKLAEFYSMPIVSSVLAKGLIPDSNPAYMGTAARVASKPGNDIMANADTILFVGSDFPFAAYFFNQAAKFIQVDIDSSKFGKRHTTDVSIHGDAKRTMELILERGHQKAETGFYKAALADAKNWHEWLAGFADSDRTPLRVEPVYKEINRIADEDTIFPTDVGNVTIDSVRFLDMNPKQKFTTSGWFATMGYGLPAGLAAQLSYPKRKVITISGDGGWAMASQDIVTEVKYKLPVVNVILSNDSFGFIKAEQDDTHQSHYGVDIEGADWGAAATALGAKGFTVRTLAELKAAFKAAENPDGPVVIDVKIADERPIPVEGLVIDTEAGHSQADVDAFNKTYESSDLVPFRKYLEEFNA